MNLILGEVDEVRSSLLPTESSSSLNEVNIQLLLVLGRLSSEEGNFGVGSKSADKHLHSLEDIRKPMFERIAQPEDMNAPSDHIVVLDRVHVLPGKLEMFSKSETMDVNAGCCSKHVCLSAKLLSPADGKDFNGDCVDVIDLFIGEVDDDLIEAIVITSLELNGFMTRVVSYVSDMCCSELEELRFLALAAGQKISSLLRVLRGLKDSAEDLTIGVLTLHGIENFLEDDFLSLTFFLVQEDVAEARSLAQEVSSLAEDLGLVEF